VAGIVADYKTIARTSRTLSVGGDVDQTFRFSLPRAVASGLDAILTFSVLRCEGLRLRIALNGTEVYDRRHGSGDVRCVQAIVGPVVRAFDNDITFTVVSGELILADVVIWFQRDADFDSTVTAGPF
jgi:hypothetical protein